VSVAVVDASIILKWVLPDEDNRREALAMRADWISGPMLLVAPTLLTYEVANGLVMATRKKRILDRELRDALGHLAVLWPKSIAVYPEAVTDVAQRLQLTAYDAAYVALASALDCPLWTGDRTLWRSARASLPSARWIGDYRRES
jgi:predicted nucleic acid-binding protein